MLNSGENARLNGRLIWLVIGLTAVWGSLYASAAQGLGRHFGLLGGRLARVVVVLEVIS